MTMPAEKNIVPSAATLAAVLRLLPDPAAPDFFPRVCAEGLSGFLYYYLNAQQLSSLVPDTVLQSLRSEYLLNLGRNLLLEEEIHRIAVSLEEERIPAVLVRGAVLMNSVYPDRGIRPLIDIDLVIADENMAAAQRHLAQKGYASAPGYPCFLAKDDIYLDLHANTTSFWQASALGSALDIRRPEVWAETVSFEGLTYVRTLGATDMILSCSEHLQWHSFERLIWLVDIAALVGKQGQDFDSERFVARAEHFRLQKTVYFIFKFLANWGWVDVPQAILGRWDRIPLNRLERAILKRLLANRRHDLPGEILALFALPSCSHVWRAMREVLFPRREYGDVAREVSGTGAGRKGRIVLTMLRKSLGVLVP